MNVDWEGVWILRDAGATPGALSVCDFETPEYGTRSLTFLLDVTLIVGPEEVLLQDTSI